jgi:hypothetical protein
MPTPNQSSSALDPFRDLLGCLIDLIIIFYVVNLSLRVKQSATPCLDDPFLLFRTDQCGENGRSPPPLNLLYFLNIEMVSPSNEHLI